MSGQAGSKHTPIYLDTAEAVASFVRSIADTGIIALDTEGASFHRFVDRIYLLQLSTREKSAVIDPLPIGSPAELGALLEDRNVEIVFHDADYDLRLLHQDYGWTVRRVFDTRVAAQLVGLKAFGLAALLEKYFDVKLDKKHQRADWSMRPLTRAPCCANAAAGNASSTTAAASIKTRNCMRTSERLSASSRCCSSRFFSSATLASA